MTVAVLGIDLAKRVFQLHGIDVRGRVVAAGLNGRGAAVPNLKQVTPMPRQPPRAAGCRA
jgi:transposase